MEKLCENPYLYYLIDTGFQGVTEVFVLSFENPTNRIPHTGYSLSKVEIKDFNVMIDAKNYFEQPFFDQYLKNLHC